MKAAFKIGGLFFLFILVCRSNVFAMRGRVIDSSCRTVEGRDNHGCLGWSLEYMPIRRISAAIYNAYPKLAIAFLVLLAICASCIASEIMWQREEQIFFNG